jgi:hypothetical protein
MTAFDLELATASLLCGFFEGQAVPTKKQISCTQHLGVDAPVQSVATFSCSQLWAESDTATVCTDLSTRNGKTSFWEGIAQEHQG